jgi:hypothetical protein
MDPARRIAIVTTVVATASACVVSSDDGRGGRAVSASAACGGPASQNWTAAPVGAAAFEVNRATRGMTSRVRWILAPDSSALVVMDDPAAVENDAIPNGLLFATERTGRVFRMDSVWSAAPSPD